MKASKRPLIRAAILFLVASLAWPDLVIADIKHGDESLSDFSSMATIRSAHFAEPLVATSATTPAEDLALSRAIIDYEQRVDPDDASSLTGFLAQYPHSAWSAALETNLGLLYLHQGYFSRAITAWQQAWIEGRSATEPRARTLVDGAVGHLAWLYGSLGKMESLSELFAEIGDRPITGSATEAVQVAREELSLVAKDPRHLFNCGPTALKSLMLAQGVKFEKADFLQWYRAGREGTSLAELAHLADKANFAYRLIYRAPGQSVPLAAIVHWKVGHFAAIIGKANGRYQVADPVFPGRTIWVTQAALDSEASGYYLVPLENATEAGWRVVSETEASTVWGKGPTTQTRQGNYGDKKANPSNSCPLCAYNILESSVSVSLSDTPVGYVPAFGPSAKIQITYNQRQDSQPQNFSFFNVSAKWSLNWLSYVTDDPTNPGANVSRYLTDSSTFFYGGYNSTTGQFTPEDGDGSVLTLSSQSPITYTHQLPDGSVEIYAQSDGSTAYPRNIFLSQIVDPQGNVLTLNYDSQRRLISFTDAVGRLTSFTYGQSGWPFLITKITDPFGRSASLTYDAYGRLQSITDILGLTSSFGYDANSLVNSLTTPYGTTSFAYTAPGTSGPPRFVQITDPLGFHEREEWLEPAPIPDSDPTATIPQGMPLAPTNQYLTYRDSFHWDKDQYVLAGCTPTGGCDYTKARDTHFLHMPSSDIKSTTIESVKNPLENRVWYSYPGQTNSIYAGTYDQPTAIGRVLDDGTTQLKQFSYNTSSFYRLTEAIDPVGRTTQYSYALNNIDLIGITQSTANGTLTPIAQFTYNNQHLPLASTDAAGQTTKFAYNASGQVTSVTNALNQITSFQRDTSGNLTSITNANGNIAATFTYDAYMRVATATDSEGWTLAYSYDAADRITKITYPDSTADLYSYDKLDLASFIDRQSRSWTYMHDANRRLSAIIDPAGQQTLFGYDNAANLTSLTDPKTNVTTWGYDVQSRLISKQYADTSTLTYTFENTTSRLKSVTDALAQTKQFTYAQDDRPSGIAYLNAVNSTPNVSFTYDPYFPRVTSMTDGNGVTQYTYTNPFSLGALQLQQECVIPSGGSSCLNPIAYAYDALGRMASRTVAGAGAETFGFDAIGRLTSHSSDLGSFALTYLGQTNQIVQRQLQPASLNLSTAWSYLPNSSDRRLAGINNTGLATSQYSNFQFTTTPENFITSIAQTSDAAATTPGSTTQTASFNNLNQLTNLSGQSLSWNANGNLLSDGQRNYSWDAENRLIGITYPGVTGKATAFSYDGLSRRTAITSTPAGGSAVTTSYTWCGTRICQARDASSAVTREYLTEGEFVPGSSAQTYYYGTDQIGSVRRVFASASSAPSYDNDPWGNALQSTAPLTDFNYAGMFYNADSGLYLTQYRAYDPVGGRWISRDPIGETSDPAANLYRYANANPINLRDPSGQFFIPGALAAGAVGGLVGGIGNLGWQLYNNGGRFSCVSKGQVAASAALGAGLGALLGGTFGIGIFAVGEAAGIGGTTAAADSGGVTLGFSQNTASAFFSSQGSFSGQSIAELASQLRAGSVAVSDVPVQIVNLGGGSLIVNTRSALALTQAGVPQSEWAIIDATGNSTVRANIVERLLNNGLTTSGTSALRITGSGPNASTLIPGH